MIFNRVRHRYASTPANQHGAWEAAHYRRSPTTCFSMSISSTGASIADQRIGHDEIAEFALNEGVIARAPPSKTSMPIPAEN
jgi:hypothetical protein